MPVDDGTTCSWLRAGGVAGALVVLVPLLLELFLTLLLGGLLIKTRGLERLMLWLVRSDLGRLLASNAFERLRTVVGPGLSGRFLLGLTLARRCGLLRRVASPLSGFPFLLGGYVNRLLSRCGRGSVGAAVVVGLCGFGTRTRRR